MSRFFYATCETCSAQYERHHGSQRYCRKAACTRMRLAERRTPEYQAMLEAKRLQKARRRRALDRL